MRRIGISALLAALALTISAACSLDAPLGPGSGTTPVAHPELGRPILFVGNSLTYVNDVPGILQAMADSAGGKKLDVQTVAFPNYALEDHWAEGTALAAIKGGGWEYVIMQQGSSALLESRINLRQWTRAFAAEIRKVNAQPGLYMVWPQSDRQFDFQDVITSYTLAASDVNGTLFPVGAAWLAVWKRDPNIALYSPDGLHPSIAGSYLAAAVMYAKLYAKSPVGLPASLRTHSGATVSVSKDLAALLQAAAAEVTGT
jgi:hypothetical protein